MIASNSSECDLETLPWLGKCNAEIARCVKSLSAVGLPAYDLRAELRKWVQNGFLAFSEMIGHELIDAYLSDIEAFCSERGVSGVKLTIEGHGVGRARDFPPEAWNKYHLRIIDLHNASTAEKALVLHPSIVEFLTHLFRCVPVAMQTVTFIHGTEQSSHQDCPYVVAEIPSHLAAVWIALEDADARAGPLYYYSGSHVIRVFDWRVGLFLIDHSTRTVDDFADHLDDVSHSEGRTSEVFRPKKGDMVFWHASLVNGGSAVEDRTLTRRSLVVHSSTSNAYTRDRRDPSSIPLVYEMNGGMVFGDPTNSDEQDRYGSWPLPAETSVSYRDLRP